MAFNAYLVFHKDVRGDEEKPGKGIFGESTSDPGDKEEKWGKGAIEITDYSFGVTMPVTTSRSDGGGATVGRANFDPFTCNKGIDTATPYLMEYCCTGKNVPSIVLHIFRSGAESESGVVKYAMIVFHHCVITEVKITGGGGDELPKESLSFNYGLCEYWYQLTDHKTGKAIDDVKPIKKGWSTITNRRAFSHQKFNEFEPAAPPDDDSTDDSSN